MSSLRKKLKAGLGYDPIVNKIGEGYKIGGGVRQFGAEYIVGGNPVW